MMCNPCVGGKRRSMKSPAHRAMAVAHIGKGAVYLVTHRTAKTASSPVFHAAESSIEVIVPRNSVDKDDIVFGLRRNLDC
jgi:hypothetical protein